MTRARLLHSLQVKEGKVSMKELTGIPDENITGFEGDDVPACVRNALMQWDELVFTAYDWYVTNGRLALGIEPGEEGPLSARLSGFLLDEHLRAYLPPDAVRLLEVYNPDWEIVIQFDDARGQLRTQRLRTAPGARHPKRVWFFEMMRRIQEEPETVDLRALPGWFIDSLDELEKMRKDREAGGQG